MIISEPFEFVTNEGERAQMYVVRNDAYCWGRMVLESGEEFDVDVDADLYDRADEGAADVLIEAAWLRYEPVASWRLGWTVTP